MDKLITTPTNSQKIQIPDLVKGYVSASISDRTKKEYRDDLKRFLDFGGSIPASPEEVASYLSQHAETHKAATLERWKISISKAHSTQQLTDPTKSELVKLTLKGIRRTHGIAQRRVNPILKEDVLLMVASLDDENLKDLRDKILLLMGFAGAFRRSELVALDVENIQETREGLTITITKSKTDQEGAGQKIGIPYARNSKCCPVKTYKKWLDASGIGNGAVFRSVSRHGKLGNRLHHHSAARVVKLSAEKIGLDPKLFSGHSLRSGLATSAAVAGVPVHRICSQTRHKSTRMLDRYIRDGRLFDDNAAGIL
jgi:integrase